MSDQGHDEPTVDPRLEEWLAVATRGLSAGAARRVRDEFIDHFLEAEADLKKSGVGGVEVVETILHGFGDPDQTGRSLRRANLRTWEAKIVQDLRKERSFGNPMALLSLVFWVSLIPAFILVTWDHIESPWWKNGIFVFCLTGLIGGVLARFWLAGYLAKKDRLREALATDVFGSWCYFATLAIGTDVIIRERSVARVAVYLMIFTFATWFVAHLWPKLGRRSTE